MEFPVKWIRPLWFSLFFTFNIFAAEKLEPIEVRPAKDLRNFDFGTFFQIEEEPTSLLSSGLKDLPYVIGTSNGGIGSRTSYFIRGAESRHILFTLDGMKLNDPSTVDRQFDDSYLLTNFMSEVTLYTGPKSTLFGSDAVGGLVDLKLSRGENAPYWKLGGSLGSFGTVHNALSKDWKNIKGRGTLGASYFRTDGVSRLNKKRFSATERDETQMVQFFSSSHHEWNSKFSTDLTFFGDQGESEQDGYEKDNSEDFSKKRSSNIQQKTNFSTSKNSAISLRNGLHKIDRLLSSELNGEETFKGETNQHELVFNTHSEKQDSVAGLLWENEKFSQEELSKKANIQSAFFQTKYKFQSLYWHGGGRLDHHDRFGEFLTATTGLSFDLELIDIKFQFSQGYKSPTLYQLYGRPVGSFKVGNSNLKPEMIDSYEMNFSFLNLGLNLFQNNFDNLITYSTTGYLNQERFSAKGLEFYGNWVKEKISLKPFIGYTDFQSDNDLILRRPNLNYGSNLSYFFNDHWEFIGKMRYFSARKDLDPEGKIVKLNPYEIYHLGLNYREENFNLGFLVQNILNREYEEMYGYSSMPRSYYINYSLSFN